MSDGMGREPAYLSSHATNRYFIPNWGNNAKYAQLTIAAIGQSVGYKSQTTFVKQFRKCTGLTPSVYQKFVAEDRRNKETGA